MQPAIDGIIEKQEEGSMISFVMMFTQELQRIVMIPHSIN